MYADQHLIMGFDDSHLESVKSDALLFLRRVAMCQRAVLNADTLEDKLDALADLITVAVAFNSLSIAIDTSSSAIVDTARSIARC